MNQQVVLISGCSSGIGLALARAFQLRDCIVVATARRALDVAALRQAGLHALPLDVTRPDSITKVVDSVQQEYGQLDILINNAGYGQFGALLDLEPEDLQRQFETNVFAPMALTRAALPLLRKTSAARIVNIGSASGILTTPFAGAYCASKAALHSLSDALRMELAPFGIFVITVQPGAISSRMGENGIAQVVLPPDSLYQPVAEAIRRRATASQENACSAEEFAQQFVAEVLRKKPARVLRIGPLSHRMPWLRHWLPLSWLDHSLSKRFGLHRLS